MKYLVSALIISLYLIGCSSTNRFETKGVDKRQVHQKYTTKTEVRNSDNYEKGNVYYWVCSYYGSKFHGRQTSNGEIFDMYKLTCAHKNLPFDTILKVTNLDNNRSVIVRVNDRGPFIEGRDLDLSYAAAEQIGLIKDGVKKLRVEIMD
ncbi:MAG: septal ring lytic transglycosylase RlpA family protein [Candidatus Cloacimonetes bacterium]|nr:septal ring lytic transglycosylase RlpA family protein [Candidatus Cloacimonadota bacterium]